VAVERWWETRLNVSMLKIETARNNSIRKTASFNELCLLLPIMAKVVE
jgi:hypothetical protein